MEQKKSVATKPASRDLLLCGTGEGIHDRLLLKPKGTASLHTEKVPRSSVLDRLQSFLPQMASANEALRQQMEAAPVGRYDIESVADAEKVIEMDVALVELEDSDSSEEQESSEDSSSDDETVTEEKLKLPGDRKRKANIQVLKGEGE
ncbi:NOP protein chaperone 1 [Salminus brasiliensis]|uniref:NOP protein chaperone 1 n=1 Tax=Salminus brasiliensis TaxID=930266 RepID=UPI003B82EFB7